ncbi:MAG: hypothetical protein GF329_14135 [Candidatus Lokiarchaeota archaeon]|nr:hypothetical protein [Candidatus Lokiarchaeota archaeon]
MTENNSNSILHKFIILAIFIVVIILTAKLDWVADPDHMSVGLGIRLMWLSLLVISGIVIPIVFLSLAGNNTRERGESDKKWFIVSIILFIIANGIPIVFYIVLDISPGFLLFLQLILFGLIPAYILQPKTLKIRILILIVLFALIILPLGFFVNSTINDLWYGGATDKTMYYLAFWGLFMTFFYLILAIGWKFGGGTKRQSWNIFVAGTLLQFSTLEDFLYFFLNGQPLPGTWPWMDSFVINLEVLFGRVPTDFDLLIYCLVISSIALFILFDGHGYVWRKIKSK